MHNNFYGFHPKHCINTLQVLKSEKTYNDSVTVAMWTKSFFCAIHKTDTDEHKGIKAATEMMEWLQQYSPFAYL